MPRTRQTLAFPRTAYISIRRGGARFGLWAVFGHVAAALTTTNAAEEETAAGSGGAAEIEALERPRFNNERERDSES